MHLCTKSNGIMSLKKLFFYIFIYVLNELIYRLKVVIRFNSLIVSSGLEELNI